MSDLYTQWKEFLTNTWNIKERDLDTFIRCVGKGKLPQRLETYQANHLESALKYLTNRRVALDIGANYGFVSHQLMSKFDKVYAFELVPSTYESLLKNKTIHKMDNVEVFNKAVSNISGIKVSHSEDRPSSFGDKINMKKGEIETITIDEMNYQNVDYMKIDVEGHELEVLQGAIKTIEKYKPILCLEVKLTGESSLLDFLDNIGYKPLEQVDKDNILMGFK